jgi:hypothetical protein
MQTTATSASTQILCTFSCYVPSHAKSPVRAAGFGTAAMTISECGCWRDRRDSVCVGSPRAKQGSGRTAARFISCHASEEGSSGAIVGTPHPSSGDCSNTSQSHGPCFRRPPPQRCTPGSAENLVLSLMDIRQRAAQVGRSHCAAVREVVCWPSVTQTREPVGHLA